MQFLHKRLKYYLIDLVRK